MICSFGIWRCDGARAGCRRALLRVPRALRSSLTSAKRVGNPLLSVSGSITAGQSTVVATGMACLPKRSQGGARRAGDMSEGRCAVAVADSESSCSLIKQLKILDNSTKNHQFNGFVNCSYLNIKSQK